MSEYVVFEFRDGEVRKFRAEFGVKGVKNSTGRPIKAILPEKYRDTSLERNVRMCLHPIKGRMEYV